MYKNFTDKCIDTVVVAIYNHFMQDFRKLEQLLLQATKKDYTNTMKGVVGLYQGDFNSSELETQLKEFSCINIQKNGDLIVS